MLSKNTMFPYACIAVFIMVTSAEASPSPKLPEPCEDPDCRNESEIVELEQPRLLTRPMLSNHDHRPKSLPLAPLTGQATIHSPHNSQIVGETFRINATLPSDWFLSGVARGRVFYFDVSSHQFVIVSEFAVPASQGLDMRSLEDKTVDFEITVPASGSRLYTLELRQAAPPDGYAPYNVSTFIEVRDGAPICMDRYCLEENIEAFEASLSDLKLNMSEPSDPLLIFDDTPYKRDANEAFGAVQEWIEIPNALQLSAVSFDLTYSQSSGSPARISLVNRLYDVRRKDCEDHFVGIAKHLEAKFGALSSDKRWIEWSRLHSETDFGVSSKYATYKDGRAFSYSAVRPVSETHRLSVDTTYENENGYVACMSRIEFEPVTE
jgi:hypothetical protein